MASSFLSSVSSAGSLALFFSHCHGETQIKPFGEGGLGAKAFTLPRAPFCHPSCFAQQQHHSGLVAPGHGFLNVTLGGSPRWFSWRPEMGSLWCWGDADAARLEQYRRWSTIFSLYQKSSQQVCNAANSRREQEATERQKVDWGACGGSLQITTTDTMSCSHFTKHLHICHLIVPP